MRLLFLFSLQDAFIIDRMLFNSRETRSFRLSCPAFEFRTKRFQAYSRRFLLALFFSLFGGSVPVLPSSFWLIHTVREKRRIGSDPCYTSRLQVHDFGAAGAAAAVHTTYTFIIPSFKSPI